MFPRVRNRAMKKIDYVTSVTIPKMLNLKSCKTRTDIINNKLDVTEKYLCENCLNVITEHKL